MKKFSLFFLFIVPFMMKAQDLSWIISFTGINASSSVDSVTVENLTQQTSLSLGGNDLLILDVTVGTDEPGVIPSTELQIFPNPSAGECRLSFPAPAEEIAVLEIFDITGKRVRQLQETASAGINIFSLRGMPDGMFAIKVTTAKSTFSGKVIIMNSNNDAGNISMEKSGVISGIPVKEKGNKDKNLKNTVSEFVMPYTAGDLLKFRGRAGLHKAIVMLVPTGSRVVTFNFIPCVDADARHYATVQIGSQFWMAENLNAGSRINSYTDQSNNGVIEKYCLYDDEQNCNTYGGLYAWNEAMKYMGGEGSQGICPAGFHIATKGEWATLVEHLGGESVAGGKLKEIGFDHWIYPNEGASDASGFSAIAAGIVTPDGYFADQGNKADIWTSTREISSVARNRAMSNLNSFVTDESSNLETAMSIRCIQDDAEELNALAGDTTKTWKLLRDVSTGRYPLQVGPYDHSTIWWAMGLNNDEIANRPCMFYDEWTFGRDGSLVFDAKSDYWAEGGIFDPNNICRSTDDMININGEDCSDWGSGNHQYGLVTGDDPKLRVLGHGAHIGFYKSATDYEVVQLSPMVQDSVRYNLVKLSDGEVDTLIVEAPYYFIPGDPFYGGYWRYVLVHYDNPADEPPFPGYAPTAGFTVVTDGLTATCTNTSANGETYLWEFGDGETATTFNAQHMYASDGVYVITLTVTNMSGSDSLSQEVWLSTIPLTAEMLQGGSWKVRVQENSIFVGSGMGMNDWWSVPLAGLDGSMIGTPEDWSCMTNDEFSFGANGSFTYQAYGDVRNDGYFGEPNGCWSESALQGNALYFASGSHTYNFTPASGGNRPVITLTNGPNRAAFIGFYKGYYGGENAIIENPPNGGFPTNTYEVMGYAIGEGTDYLFLSVDITSDHLAWAAWSVILERE